MIFFYDGATLTHGEHVILWFLLPGIHYKCLWQRLALVTTSEISASSFLTAELKKKNGAQ